MGKKGWAVVLSKKRIKTYLKIKPLLSIFLSAISLCFHSIYLPFYVRRTLDCSKFYMSYNKLYLFFESFPFNSIIFFAVSEIVVFCAIQYQILVYHCFFLVYSYFKLLHFT